MHQNEKYNKKRLYLKHKFYNRILISSPPPPRINYFTYSEKMYNRTQISILRTRLVEIIIVSYSRETMKEANTTAW